MLYKMVGIQTPSRPPDPDPQTPRLPESGSLGQTRTSRLHRIVRGGRYDWLGYEQRYAWSVSATRRLTETIPQPGPKGVTGFRVPRSYHARFADGFCESRG